MAASTHRLAIGEARGRSTAAVTEDVSRVDKALARLPEEKRLVLLIDREGLSGNEVAEALHVPVNTVWTRLHYARAELRTALRP